MTATTDTRRLILGTAGHIDHGKTALIAALTGVDTDRLPEEKQRGITIDIGFANLAIDGYALGVVDVPGHERFVKNMLAGAVGVDVALLVIAADDSVMPQTREHLAILQILGVKHGLIAITKSDLAEPTWLELVEEEVRELVAGTFLEGAPIVRTSAAPGRESRGIDELRDALRNVCDRVEPEPDSALFRLPADRTFTVQGRGTVITGTVWSGTLSTDDEVEWLPAGKPLRVRGLQSHGSEVESIAQGQRAAINLIGVHHTEIARGHEIATPGYLRSSKLMTVDLRVLPSSPWPIKHKSRQRLYLGTQEVMVSVSLLDGAAIEPGDSATALLFCAEPATAVCGQPFVLRAESPLITIGGGAVLQPVAPRMARRSRRAADRRARLDALRSDDAAERAAAAIAFFGTQPWNTLDLCRDAALEVDEAKAIESKLREAGELVELPVSPKRSLRVQRDVLAQLESRVTEALRGEHKRRPLDAAVSRTRVAELLRMTDDQALVNAVLDRLIDAGSLQGDEQSVADAKFAPRLSAQQIALRDGIVAAFADAGVSPPSEGDLGGALKASESQVRQMLDLCAAQGELVHLGGGLYLHAAAHADMQAKVRDALSQSADGMTMSQLRDVLGTTRKFAVPIFEYLDRVGFTKRKGDVRVLGKAANVATDEHG